MRRLIDSYRQRHCRILSALDPSSPRGLFQALRIGGLGVRTWVGMRSANPIRGRSAPRCNLF